MEFGEAIDAYIGELARQGRAASTLASYRRLLNDFATHARKRYVEELTLRDYERFLDRWVGMENSTLASGVSLIRRFSLYLWKRGYTETWTAEPLERPKRKHYEDLAVTTISGEQAAALLNACADWQEFLCLATALYLGARRSALAAVRRADVDLVRGTVRFLEKGGKVAVKPLPREYQEVLVAAERDGLWESERDYLIPNRRAASVRGGERSDKIVYETVKRVAERAGVDSHVHALRAAFAVQFDEQHPGENFALKDLMGHTRIETTLVYLRRKDKARAMESNRDLTWGKPSVFSESPEEAHTGFEPVPPTEAVDTPVRRKLAELTARSAARGHVR